MMRRKNKTRSSQHGYALLVMVFLIAMMAVAALQIGLSVRTEAKREKEEEMIWRGKQYVRGIKLYYKKLGRYPTSLDDLVKPQQGNVHFMRQSYKDPMNKEDGSWRLLYVGPSGQLIGSLKPPQTSSLLPQGGALGAGTAPAGLSGLQGGQQQPPGSAPTPSTGFSNSSSGNQSGDSGNNGTDSSSNPQPLNPTGTTIIGGNIVGVGSKVNERSLKVYEKAKNYRLFEFYWDPSKDQQIVGGAPGLVGTPAGQQPGGTSSPFGQQPPTNPSGTNPNGNPPPGSQQPNSSPNPQNNNQ